LRLGQLISLLLCLAEALFLLRLLGDVPSTSAAQRGQGSVSDEPQPDYASPKPQAGCRPALGLCGHLFLVESRSHLVCCGRRRDRDVGFEDSNASRLLHGSSAIRTKTTVVRQLVSVRATIPVHYDSTLRLAAFPLHTHHVKRDMSHGVRDSTRQAAAVIHLNVETPATLMGPAPVGRGGVRVPLKGGYLKESRSAAAIRYSERGKRARKRGRASLSPWTDTPSC
jgi:hypothetical protein